MEEGEEVEEEKDKSKRREWRTTWSGLSSEEKMPFEVDAIRLRTQQRSEMYTSLGFRNADPQRVRVCARV